MFSLTGATKFMFIPNYKDMRGEYDKLHSVVCFLVGRQEEGTAYLFTSRNHKLVKMIRHVHNECQLYIQRFDHDMSFVRLTFEGTHPIYTLELTLKRRFPYFKDNQENYMRVPYFTHTLPILYLVSP